MYRQNGRYYADWFDAEGVRRRKVFRREHEAIAYEHLQEAVKCAIKSGREERAMALWQSFEIVEQPLRALTESAGWPPYTTGEIQESVNDLVRRTRANTSPRLVGLNRRIQRKLLLNIILSAVLKPEPEAANTQQDRLVNLSRSTKSANSAIATTT